MDRLLWMYLVLWEEMLFIMGFSRPQAHQIIDAYMSMWRI